ncbi:MAG: hypothetical protein KAT70_03160, partial [Thermoplasmata archaeon]|nr:hypothetical protein [Thermoplasmata archaeon]
GKIWYWEDLGTTWYNFQDQDIAFKTYYVPDGGVDQRQGNKSSGMSNDFWSDRKWGQTFYPSVDTIAQVDVFLEDSGSSGEITLEIYTNNPQSTFNFLGSTSLHPDDFMNYRWNTFAFDMPIYVTPGEQYFFSLNSSAGRYRPYGRDGGNDPYNYGTAWYDGGASTWNEHTTRDLAFMLFSYLGEWDYLTPTGWDTSQVDLNATCYAPDSGVYVAVGYNISSGTGAVSKYDIGEGTWTDLSSPLLGGGTLNSIVLRDIAWHPTEDYGIICGGEPSGRGYVYRLNGATKSPPGALYYVSDHDYELNAVKWSPDGTEALIVGNSGIVLSYKNDTADRCDVLHADYTEYSGNQIDWTGICIKPPNSP